MELQSLQRRGIDGRGRRPYNREGRSRSGVSDAELKLLLSQHNLPRERFFYLNLNVHFFAKIFSKKFKKLNFYTIRHFLLIYVLISLMIGPWKNIPIKF